MKAYGGITGTSPFFPALGTRGVRAISFTFRLLYTRRMILRFPLYRVWVDFPSSLDTLKKKQRCWILQPVL